MSQLALSSKAPQPRVLDAAARVLIIKLATPGDVLLAAPALRALHRRYPDARIDVLTTPASAAILRDSPHVNEVYALNKYAFDYPRQILAAPWRLLGPLPLLAKLRAQRYDAVLLLHHLTLWFGTMKYATLLRAISGQRTLGLDNGRGGFLSTRIPDEGFGALHEAEYNLAVAAALDAHLDSHERGPRVEDLGWELPSPLSSESERRPIALHPGSGRYSYARRWPADRFAELAAALHEETGDDIVLMGGFDERELHDTILARLACPTWMRSAAGQTGPHELALLLARCRLLVANDSFPMHLAVAVGTPVVAIFGPSNVRAWGPYTPDAPDAALVVRRTDLPCSPCMYRGHTLGTPQGCPGRPCLTTLEVRRVLEAARLQLRQQPRSAPAAPAG